MYVISACLAGRKCRYNGGSNEIAWVKDLSEKSKCILVCPEEEGNLPTPRNPSERVGDKVLDKEGNDVTNAFILGSERTMLKINEFSEKENKEVKLAILKSNSPSCGCGMIYDGTFSGKLVKGDGLFVEMLKEKGIKIISEKDEEALNE
ncbi:DUF523 domain-containing protein [Anaerovorax odorimutans]|uniref:DUF523 domain-containing protein n=1 Tax=Anaerovorax odorimutans TaxID=109327 RepID=UPI0003FD0450|nr:DUF523 domain-containing protein [Anaerovorax odorimutans]